MVTGFQRDLANDFFRFLFIVGGCDTIVLEGCDILDEATDEIIAFSLEREAIDGRTFWVLNACVPRTV